MCNFIILESARLIGMFQMLIQKCMCVSFKVFFTFKIDKARENTAIAIMANTRYISPSKSTTFYFFFTIPVNRSI